MPKKACIRYFNSDLQESGEVFEYQRFSSYYNTGVRALEFVISDTDQRIFNFDHIIQMRLFEE